MNVRVVHAIALGLLGITSGCSLVTPPRAAPPAPSPLTVRIFLCEHRTRVRLRNAWRDSGLRVSKKEPVYTSQTRTWIEIYLPEHKLARSGGFVEATEARYKPTPRAAGILTSATELTGFTLTPDALAQLRQALDKHLKSKGRTRPKQQSTQPPAAGDPYGTPDP